MVIEKRRNLTGYDLGDMDRYLLKVCGREEFLILMEIKHVAHCGALNTSKTLGKVEQYPCNLMFVKR